MKITATIDGLIRGFACSFLGWHLINLYHFGCIDVWAWNGVSFCAVVILIFTAFKWALLLYRTLKNEQGRLQLSLCTAWVITLGWGALVALNCNPWKASYGYVFTNFGEHRDLSPDMAYGWPYASVARNFVGLVFSLSAAERRAPPANYWTLDPFFLAVDFLFGLLLELGLAILAESWVRHMRAKRTFKFTSPPRA